MKIAIIGAGKMAKAYISVAQSLNFNIVGLHKEEKKTDDGEEIEPEKNKSTLFDIDGKINDLLRDFEKSNQQRGETKEQTYKSNKTKYLNGYQ